MTHHDTPDVPPSAPARQRRSHRLARLTLAGLGAGVLLGNLSLGGCSLVLSFDQCKTDADCDFGNGGVCNDGRCVAENVAEDTGDGDGDSSGTDGTGGTDTSTTTEPETDDGSGTDTGEPLDCTSHTECVAAHNNNWLCSPEGTCMSGITAECQTLRWPNNTPQDRVVFVGSILPTSPPFDTLTLPLQNAMLLGLEDFNKEASLPDGSKLAWIACDSRGSTTLAKTAAQHLVDVGVPAIIGPLFSEEVMEVAEEVAVPNGVFVLAPAATNKAITHLDDDDLVWRTIASDVYQANALADRMNAIASLDSTVIVYKNDAYGTDLTVDAYAALSAPLMAATKTYPYQVHADMEDLLDEIAALLGPIVANDQPETLVIVGTSEATAIILTYLAVASQINPQLIPERFIMTHGAVPGMTTTINSAPNDPTRQLLYSLMEGVAPIIFDETNFNAFNIRYKIRFNDQDAITTSSLTYDSLLVIGFAMAAIPDGEPVTGANIAAQMHRLVDKSGPLINFSGGTSFIATAVNALSTGNSVDLRGVSGPLDFDLETGDIRTNYIGWEVAPIAGDLTKPALVPQRMYVLHDEPATDGVWIDLP